MSQDLKQYIFTTYPDADANVICGLFDSIVDASAVDWTEDLSQLFTAMNWFVSASDTQTIREALEGEVGKDRFAQITGVVPPNHHSPSTFIHDFQKLVDRSNMSVSFDPDNQVTLFDINSERQTAAPITLEKAIKIMEAKAKCESLMEDWF